MRASESWHTMCSTGLKSLAYQSIPHHGHGEKQTPTSRCSDEAVAAGWLLAHDFVAPRRQYQSKRWHVWQYQLQCNTMLLHYYYQRNSWKIHTVSEHNCRRSKAEAACANARSCPCSPATSRSFHLLQVFLFQAAPTHQTLFNTTSKPIQTSLLQIPDHFTPVTFKKH